MNNLPQSGLDLPTFDAIAAFRAYERVRHRLPKASFGGQPRGAGAGGLLDIAERYDLFVFDAFGVLNVGETPIPGARACIEALRAQGKSCVVITNAASYDRNAAVAKFRRLGFDFSADEIVSSRMAAEQAMAWIGDVGRWGVAGLGTQAMGDVPVRVVPLEDDADAYRWVEGVLFLSTLEWTMARQEMLEAALEANARPVVIANPDIVAPREDGFSTEPGFFGHRLADLGFEPVIFHGKPYPSVYDMVRCRFPRHGDPSRICMVGDTLHTDILGGASQGWGTILVTGHGLFKGMAIEPLIAESGIVPDWTVPSI